MSDKRVTDIRKELTAQRRVYKEVEARRNALINTMYVEGKTVAELVELFGMREYNIIKTLTVLNEGALPIQKVAGLNLSL